MTLEEIWNNRDNPVEITRLINEGVPCYQCWGFATRDSRIEELTKEQALAMVPDYVPHNMLLSVRATNRNGTPGILFETLSTSDLY